VDEEGPPHIHGQPHHSAHGKKSQRCQDNRLSARCFTSIHCLHSALQNWIVSLELADRLVAPNCIGLDPGQNIDNADRKGVLTVILMTFFTALSRSGGHCTSHAPVVPSREQARGVTVLADVK